MKKLILSDNTVSIMKGLLNVFILIALVSVEYTYASEECQAQAEALGERITKLENVFEERIHHIEQRLSEDGTLTTAESNETSEIESKADALVREILRLASDEEIEMAKAKIVEFRTTYGNTQTAKKAESVLSDLETVGKLMPNDFTFERWYQGEENIDLKGNKTTLLVFWDVGCPYCETEVPRLQELYNNFREQGFQMVAVTKAGDGTTETEITEFLKTHHVEYPSAKDSGVLSDYFNVTGVPAAVVLKHDKVIWRGHPVLINDDAIKFWLTDKS